MPLGIENQGPNNVVQTTNGTQVVALTYTVPEDCTLMAKCNVLARSGSAQAVWNLYFAAKRVSDGDADVVGVPEISLAFKETSALLWDVDIDTDGSDVRVLVKGLANVTIDWGAQVDMVQLLPVEGGS